MEVYEGKIRSIRGKNPVSSLASTQWSTWWYGLQGDSGAHLATDGIQFYVFARLDISNKYIHSSGYLITITVLIINKIITINLITFKILKAAVA